MCAGKGIVACPDCTFGEGDDGLVLTQSKLANVTSTRPAMVPPEPTPIPTDAAQTIKQEDWRAQEPESPVEVAVVEIVRSSTLQDRSDS